ncbi:SGNH/GDSL hydrolase family protein [Pelagicoccus sp. SDUM812002]|uniref:SGNH/GDSL hydrolase family protein n=1 Tax=Pelagicoccus sp. SDUM812002 TaxID=3041266 RepID=UPI00280E772B|nr:SGNH/GDSL hydrolase family protein [Pelagicoccus sp. SDUM812002]MDQ8188221.1 SGNH/GDSL hydrolase family protein [Pelagicoccus sp. SDUM812002]
MRLPQQTKLLFIGDSITDAGRDQSGEPTPWCNTTGLGHGYVNLVNSLIQSSDPASRVRILNLGLSGNTIRDLAARWKRDVLDLAPQWLSVKIGINDVWRQFDQPHRIEAHVLPLEYEQTYRSLLAKTRPALQGLVIISPYFIEPNKVDPMRARMDEYGAIARKVAKEFDALFVDSQAAMDQLTEQTHPAEIAWDRVHPSTVGHMAIAQAFMNAID